MPGRTTHPLLAAALVLASLLLSAPAQAIRLEAEEDIFFDLHVLIQPQLELSAAPPGDGDEQWSFFLRRMRLIVGGQVTSWIKFFFETDAPNWGKGGDWAPDTFIVQDAYVMFDIHEALQISSGMLLLPFARPFQQSAVSLVTLDYHGVMARYPKGSHKVWRGMGASVAGQVLDGYLNYRVGLTRGSNATTAPRTTGRIGFSALDPDGGVFAAGTKLGKTKRVSGGLSFDVQPDVFGRDTVYYGLGADVGMDLAVSDRVRLSGQLAYLHYGDQDHPEGGDGLLFDLGVGVGDIQPTVAVDWFRPTGSDALHDDLLGLHLGFALFLHGHNATLKLDLALVKDPGVDFDAARASATLQAQLFL